MKIPLNVTAELVLKLEAENLAFQNQVASLQEVIVKNAEGITTLEPFAEWSEETPA